MENIFGKIKTMIYDAHQEIGDFPTVDESLESVINRYGSVNFMEALVRHYGWKGVVLIAMGAVSKEGNFVHIEISDRDCNELFNITLNEDGPERT